MPTSGPLNPSKAWLRAATPGSAAYIRLAFALWYLPLDEGAALLSLGRPDGTGSAGGGFQTAGAQSGTARLSAGARLAGLLA